MVTDSARAAMYAAHASWTDTREARDAGRATNADVERAAKNLSRAADARYSGGNMGASGANGGNYGGACNEG